METNAPTVSVLIPSYNYAEYLSEAIDSVLAQTYKNFELIIIDNCSTDKTSHIVNEYIKKDSRIKLHINKTNIGMFRNYNESLLLANGKYIKFLNADDRFHPEILEKFIKILDENESVSVVTSYRQDFQNSSKIDKQDFNGLQDGKDMILLALSKLNFIGEPTTVMIRKSNLNLGLFDTSLIFFADLDMWLRHLSIGNLYIVDKVLSYTRKHELQGTNILREDTNKSIFIALQWPEYIRNSILMNRFGYNFYIEDLNTIKKIFKKSNKIPHRLLFTNSDNNQRVKDYFSSLNKILYLRYLIKNMFKKNK